LAWFRISSSLAGRLYRAPPRGQGIQPGISGQGETGGARAIGRRGAFLIAAGVRCRMPRKRSRLIFCRGGSPEAALTGEQPRAAGAILRRRIVDLTERAGVILYTVRRRRRRMGLCR
jgi:hypothetical protein